MNEEARPSQSIASGPPAHESHFPTTTFLQSGLPISSPPGDLTVVPLPPASSPAVGQDTPGSDVDRSQRRRRSQAELQARKVLKEHFPKRKRGRPSREDSEAYERKLLELGLSGLKATNEQPSLWPNPSSSIFPSLSPFPLVQQPWTSVAEGTHLDPAASKEHLVATRKVDTSGGRPDMAGHGLQGVIEGVFDSGYFVSVKVEGEGEGEGTWFRGVVFGPLNVNQPGPAGKSSGSISTEAPPTQAAPSLLSAPPPLPQPAPLTAAPSSSVEPSEQAAVNAAPAATLESVGQVAVNEQTSIVGL
eukprot:TRINITY_DN20882_c0_g1_i1.p1 TRINITY_DN20882_c0_g1~~TRINITY_DN20882_c0_g1_i1.p1  ORF type:complete len:303 (+),score=49.27 TRINITY_DN20882_c0_g1_i1:142-1050(+)